MRLSRIVAVATSLFYSALAANNGLQTTVEWDNGSLMIKGERIMIMSGEFRMYILLTPLSQSKYYVKRVLTNELFVSTPRLCSPPRPRPLVRRIPKIQSKRHKHRKHLLLLVVPLRLTRHLRFHLPSKRPAASAFCSSRSRPLRYRAPRPLLQRRNERRRLRSMDQRRQRWEIPHERRHVPRDMVRMGCASRKYHCEKSDYKRRTRGAHAGGKRIAADAICS